MIVVNLKDSQSVLSASKMIEGLTADLNNSNVIGVEVKEAFGNADIEEAPVPFAASSGTSEQSISTGSPRKNTTDESGMKEAFDNVKPAGDGKKGE